MTTEICMCIEMLVFHMPAPELYKMCVDEDSMLNYVGDYIGEDVKWASITAFQEAAIHGTYGECVACIDEMVAQSKGREPSKESWYVESVIDLICELQGDRASIERSMQGQQDDYMAVECRKAMLG